MIIVFFFSSRRRHTRYWRDWSSDVCSSDLAGEGDLVDGIVLDDQLAHRAIAGHDIDHAGWQADLLADLGERQRRERRPRSEERRVGKECRSRWSPYH